MTKFTIPLVLSVALQVSASNASETAGPFSGWTRLTARLQGWSASCEELAWPGNEGLPFRCGIPAPLAPPPAGFTELEFNLRTDLEPGYADGSAQGFVISSGKEGEAGLLGKLTLFSVHPPQGSGERSKDAAIPPYVQVRVDLLSPVRATCAESVRLRQPLELPPLICAGFTQGAPAFEQRGVTIKFSD